MDDAGRDTMSKGSWNRTKNRRAYREHHARIFKRARAVCTCDEEPGACGVHNCPYCDGTGRRFNGEKCDHRARKL